MTSLPPTNDTGNNGNERVEGMLESWLSRVENKLDVAIADIRAEMRAGDELRVSKDAFSTYKEALENRLSRLESSPTRILGWLGFVCGIIGGPMLLVVLRLTGH